MAKIIKCMPQGEILAQMAEEKKITRLVDVGELEADLLFCESIEDELSDLENLPTIDPESLRPTAKWIIVRRMADGAECKRQHSAEAAYTREMLDTGKVYHYDHEDRHRERGRKKYMGANGGADR